MDILPPLLKYLEAVLSFSGQNAKKFPMLLKQTWLLTRPSEVFLSEISKREEKTVLPPSNMFYMAWVFLICHQLEELQQKQKLDRQKELEKRRKLDAKKNAAKIEEQTEGTVGVWYDSD